MSSHSESVIHNLEDSKPRLHSNKSIASRLNIARKKLLPVINEILKTASANASRMPYQNPKSYHLTIEQYKDAVWASEVLKEVDELLKFNNLRKHLNKSFNFKPQNFNFGSKNIKVNKSGKIYVDTPILVQLIDLHNMLGDFINYIKDLPREGQKYLHLPREGQKYLHLPPKSKPSSQYKSNATSSDSLNKNKKAEVEKITREILTSLTLPMNTNFLVMAANSVHKSKSKMPCLPEERSASEINLTSETKVQVRLSKSTGSVLHAEEKSKVVDALAARNIIIRCLADLDKVKQYLEDQDSCSTRKTPSALSLTDNANLEDPCLCCECPSDEGEPLNFVWQEDGENGSKLIICIKGKTEEDGDIHVVIRQCPECADSPKDDRHSPQRFNVSVENLEKLASSKVSFSNRRLSDIGSRNQSQNEGINIFFDPDEPSESIVEGPQMKLFETININLQNSEGQDLVISLSVRPKGNQRFSSGINLDDIFSESRTQIDKKSRVHVVERMIPLSRTKICSSMEFDVDLVLSKLRKTGVQHPNPEVSERLNDLGVSNILRASRPVKCGRMAILNEYQKKSLPYSASLRSLPLSDDDIDVINQSIDMSLQQSKHSKIFPKNHHVHFQKCVYFFKIQQNGVEFWDKWDVRRQLVNRKMNFYIYLEGHSTKLLNLGLPSKINLKRNLFVF